MPDWQACAESSRKSCLMPSEERVCCTRWALISWHWCGPNVTIDCVLCWEALPCCTHASSVDRHDHGKKRHLGCLVCKVQSLIHSLAFDLYRHGFSEDHKLAYTCSRGADEMWSSVAGLFGIAQRSKALDFSWHSRRRNSPLDQRNLTRLHAIWMLSA